MMWLMTLLQMFLFIGMSFQINEECLSNNIKRHEIKEKHIFPITTYLTDEYNILFQITFEDRMEALDMDYIRIKPESYEIKRKRNGDESIDRFNTSTPFGWVTMNITIGKHAFHINPYIGNITSEYPMQHLSIASQYLASCEQGTPSWKIVRDKAITVPLNYIGRSQISFTSESAFSPFIIIIGLKFYLTNESGITLGSSGMKLTPNTYKIIIEHEDNVVRLSYKKEECDMHTLLSLKLRTTVLNITIGTLNEDFTLVLEPIVYHTRNCEITSDVYSNITESTQQSNDITGLVILAVILVLLLMIAVTILILLKLNGPKYAAIFHLQILSDQNKDTEQLRKSRQYDIGTDENHTQQKEILVETITLLNSHQGLNTESKNLQQQLEAKNTDNCNLQQSLLENKTKIEDIESYNIQQLPLVNETKIKGLQQQPEAKNKDNYNLQHSLQDNKITIDGLQQQLNVKNTETHNLNQSLATVQSQLQNLQIKADRQDKSLKAKEDKNVVLQRQLKELEKQKMKEGIKGEACRILLIIRNKENPDDKIPVDSDGNEEYNSQIFANGRDVLDVLFTIMKKFPNDKVLQSDGMQKLTQMKDKIIIKNEALIPSQQLQFTEAVVQAFEADIDNEEVNLSCSIILKEVKYIEKFYERVVRAALYHIKGSKDSKILLEYWTLLYYLFNKENIKDKEDMIAECMGAVLKAFENNHSTEVSLISSQILMQCMVTEKDKLKLPAQLVRMSNAAVVHIERDEAPEVVSNCFTFLNSLLSKTNPDQREHLVNSHLIKVILNSIKTKIQDENVIHKLGWKILEWAVNDSKTNCDTLIDIGGANVILEYLQKPSSGAVDEVVGTVLTISINIARHPHLHANLMTGTFLKIFYVLLEKGHNKWDRTSAAEILCLLGGSVTGQTKEMKSFSTKAFKKLIECIEKKDGLQLSNKVDPAEMKKWKKCQNPEQNYFEEMRKYLMPIK